MTSILAHVEEVPAVEPASDYIGNPMYGVIAEHAPALVAVLVVGLFAFVVARSARRDESRFAAVDARYRALTPVLRLLFWLLAVAAVVHAGLVFGHEPGFYTVAYATGAAAECWVALRLLNGSPWRGRTAIVLIGSLLAFSVSNFSGEPPDEVGIATKLVEIAALWIVVTAPFERRWRRAAGSGAMLVLSLVVFIGTWAGAFSGVEENHHVGEASQPGTLIPAGEDRPPTLHEIEDADELYEAVVAAVAKYEDPAVAATDGYAVDGMYGRDFHAANEAYKRDGRIFDPERPENLIYAVTEDGPVLTGVMFEMEGLGKAGPGVGGPLTVWHAHEEVCFSLTPPSLAGLTSPFGVCPLGSLTIPVTNEMIHVWTLPGAPDRFGHLDDEWLDDYLERDRRDQPPGESSARGSE